jgi:hypothetical protein
VDLPDGAGGNMPHGRVRKTNFKRRSSFTVTRMPHGYVSWLQFLVDTYDFVPPYFTESKTGTRYLVEGQDPKRVRLAAKKELEKLDVLAWESAR